MVLQEKCSTQMRFDLLHFIILNIFFLGTEEISWMVAFFTLLNEYPTWAYLTLFWMFVGFLISLFMFIIKGCCGHCCCLNCCCDCCKECCERHIRDLLISIHLIKTIYNIFFSIQLYKLGYGRENIEHDESEEIEKIISKGEYEMGLYGSFFGTLFQIITQFVFYRIIGWISVPQIVCIVLSLLRLIWGIGLKITTCYRNHQVDEGDKFEMQKLRIKGKGRV